MKKLFTLSLFSVMLVMSAGATVISVAVMNSSFNPATVTANCGDTIRWTLQSNFSHTTTSTTIPTTAASWNAPINSTSTTFSYQVTVAGTYNYICTPHGFAGVIVVSCPSNVPQVSTPKFTGLFPNPCTDHITIQFQSVDQLMITNVIGEQMLAFRIGTGNTEMKVDLADLPKGLYFVRLMKEGQVITTRKFTKAE